MLSFWGSKIPTLVEKIMIASRPHVFTSESVTEGHPDKMADQISDAILDNVLQQDPNARVAIETVLKNNLVLLAGEISSHAAVNFGKVASQVIDEIGYKEEIHSFGSKASTIMTVINEQSADIALGVDAKEGKELGAGDQGMMFGFACDETPELMPLPITYAHKLAKNLAQARKTGLLPFLGPDGKTQVTVFYENSKAVGLSEIVVSSQHEAQFTQSQIKEAIIEEVIKKTIAKEHLLPNIKFHINPTGAFVVGGPMGDAGLTGRKIIVDTYGGMGRHGGGAFSGKDPSKVDRSAAYMARFIAKNVVAAGLARQCEVQLAYAIGESEPVSVMLNTFGSSKLPEEKIEEAIKKLMPLTPQKLIEFLQLKRPIYQKTSVYGHFGRQDADFSWEQNTLVEALKDALK